MKISRRKFITLSAAALVAGVLIEKPERQKAQSSRQAYAQSLARELTEQELAKNKRWKSGGVTHSTAMIRNRKDGGSPFVQTPGSAWFEDAQRLYAKALEAMPDVELSPEQRAQAMFEQLETLSKFLKHLVATGKNYGLSQNDTFQKDFEAWQVENANS